jgi:hypothetical protein
VKQVGGPRPSISFFQRVVIGPSAVAALCWPLTQAAAAAVVAAAEGIWRMPAWGATFIAGDAVSTFMLNMHVDL